MESLLAISALQHYCFCPRQCALIHIEYLWEDNSLTAEGNILHQKVDEGDTNARGNTQTLRSLHVSSMTWGIIGVTDVVEIIRNRTSRTIEQILPVEYKRGKPKGEQMDDVQLCAQVLCLEEMLQIPIEYGYLYYEKIKRRQQVDINNELRQFTQNIIQQTKQLIHQGATPPANKQEHCKSCSLLKECLPKLNNVQNNKLDKLFSSSLETIQTESR